MKSDENEKLPKTIRYKNNNFLNALKYIKIIEVSAHTIILRKLLLWLIFNALIEFTQIYCAKFALKLCVMKVATTFAVETL